jgi:hypothetical protein
MSGEYSIKTPIHMDTLPIKVACLETNQNNTSHVRFLVSTSLRPFCQAVIGSAATDLLYKRRRGPNIGQ